MRETLAYLLEEQTACWQGALEKAPEAAPKEKLESLFTALFSNKICTRKKLCVWAAFVAHAATHAPYRFEIAQASALLRETIASQLKTAQATPPQLTDQLMALVDGLWMAQILGDTMRERKELVALCMAASHAPGASVGSKSAIPTRREEKKPALPVKPARKAALKPRVEKDEAPVVADLFASL